MLQSQTLIASGSAPINTVVSTLVALINAPGPGRYRIWGTCRHSLADGLKLTSPMLTPLVISGGAGDTINIGPIIIDITNNTSGINIALNVATGASDTASATLYAERITAP